MIQNRESGYENQITLRRKNWNKRILNKYRRQRNGNEYDSNCHGGTQGPL